MHLFKNNNCEIIITKRKNVIIRTYFVIFYKPSVELNKIKSTYGHLVMKLNLFFKVNKIILIKVKNATKLLQKTL